MALYNLASMSDEKHEINIKVLEKIGNEIYMHVGVQSPRTLIVTTKSSAISPAIKTLRN